MLSRVLGPGLVIFRGVRCSTEDCRRYKPLIHCLRRDNPETVRRYVKSYIEAIQLMKSDREISIKVLAKYLRSIKDREILAKTYDGAIPDNKFWRKQYPSIPGLQMALDLLAEENPKAKSAKPDDFVDVRFIKELDQSGYIDGLYKAKEN